MAQIPKVSIDIDRAAAQKAIAAINTSLKTMQAELQRLNKTVGKINTRMKTFPGRGSKKKIKDTNKAIKGLNLGLFETAKTAQLAFGPLSGLAARITAFGSLANKAAIKVAVLLATITGLGFILLKIIKTTADFEQQMITVGKIAGFTSRQLEGFQRTILAFSGALSLPVKGLADISAEAARLGIKGIKDISSFTTVIGKLQTATNLAGSTAATQIARILKVTGTATKEVLELANVIVVMGNNAAASESEIVEAALAIARTGGIFGLDKTDVVVLGAAFAQFGIQAEIAGTAVGRVLASIREALTTSGLAARNLAVIMGQSLKQIKQDFEQEALVALVRFLAGVRELDRRGTLATETLRQFGLSGIREAKALLPLIKNLDEVIRLTALRNLEQKRGTALETEFQKFISSTSSQAKALVSNIRNIAIALGLDLLPAIKSILKGLNSFIKDSEKAATTIRIVIGVLGSLIFLLGLGGLGSVISIAVTGLAFLGRGLLFLLSPLILVIKGLTLLIGRLGFLALAAISPLAPFLAIGTAVALVGLPFIAFGNIVKEVGLGFAAALNKFFFIPLENFGTFVNNKIIALKNAFLDLKEFISGEPTGIREIGVIGRKRAPSIGSQVDFKRAFKRDLTNLESLLKGFKNKIGDLLGGVLEKGKGLFETILGDPKQIAEIRRQATELEAEIARIREGIKGAGEEGDIITTAVQKLFDEARQISAVLSGNTDEVLRLGRAAKAIKIESVLKDFSENQLVALGKGLKEILGFAAEIPVALNNQKELLAFRKFIATIIVQFREARTEAERISGRLETGIRDTISSTITSALQGNFKEAGKGLLSGFKDTIAKAIGESVAENLRESFIRPLANALKEAIISPIAGVISGFVSKFTGKLVDLIPKKVAAAIGAALVAGKFISKLFKSAPKAVVKLNAAFDQIFVSSLVGSRKAVGAARAAGNALVEVFNKLTSGIDQLEAALDPFANILAGTEFTVKAGKKKPFRIRIGGKKRKFATIDELAVALIDEAVGRGAFADASPVLQKILSSISTGAAISDIQAAVDFAEAFVSGFGELLPPLTDFGKELKDLKKTMDDARATALSFGLSIKTIDLAEQLKLQKKQVDFNKEIRLSILDIIDPLSAELERLKEAQAARLKDATDIGANLVALEKLGLLERQKAIESFAGQTSNVLQDFLVSITASTQSKLPTQTALANAQRRFSELRIDFLAGNVGLASGLVDAAQNLLDLRRAFDASGPGFFQTQAFVEATINKALGVEGAGGDPQLAVLQDLNFDIKEGNQTLEEIRDILAGTIPVGGTTSDGGVAPLFVFGPGGGGLGGLQSSGSFIF